MRVKDWKTRNSLPSHDGMTRYAIDMTGQQKILVSENTLQAL